MRFALISDTHIFPNGQRSISPQVFDLFAGPAATMIVHGGDVATAEVIDKLAEIAPVLAVRGNNDHGHFGRSLPMRIDLTVGERLIRVVHGHGGRSARAVAGEVSSGCDAVIYGHSHIPMIERVGRGNPDQPGLAVGSTLAPALRAGVPDRRCRRHHPELVLFTDPRELDRIELPPDSGRG